MKTHDFDEKGTRTRTKEKRSRGRWDKKTKKMKRIASDADWMIIFVFWYLNACVHHIMQVLCWIEKNQAISYSFACKAKICVKFVRFSFFSVFVLFLLCPFPISYTTCDRFLSWSPNWAKKESLDHSTYFCFVWFEFVPCMRVCVFVLSQKSLTSLHLEFMPNYDFIIKILLIFEITFPYFRATILLSGRRFWIFPNIRNSEFPRIILNISIEYKNLKKPINYCILQ